MGVLYGLLAALGWGAGDFVLSRITRTIGPLRTMLYVQLVGIVTIGLVLLARRDLPPLDSRLWLLAVWVNLFNLGGTLLLYRAMAVGTLAIVSPITASFAVVTAVLAVAGGERPAPLALGGVALVVAGVIVVSRPPGERGAPTSGPGRLPMGVPAAMGTALCFGIYFWLLSPVTAAMGIAWPVFVGRVLNTVFALMLLAGKPRAPHPPSPKLWGAIVLATCLDTAGFLCYNIGIATAYVSVVTALASIFSAVTVLLAWLLLRERLVSLQWAGVAAVLVGVLLVSM